MHTLIVGAVHVGKSTLIQKVIRALGCPVSGYETRKEDGMADNELGSPVYIYNAGMPHRQTPENLIGYSRDRHPAVNAAAFDRFAPHLAAAAGQGGLIVLDEIGFMETASAAFCGEVIRLLDGSRPIIAAVKRSEIPYLNAVRNHPNCRPFLITEENRDALFPEVLDFVRRQLNEAEAADHR